MKKYSHKYFLRIDEEVIDLNNVLDLNMEHFLNLVLFTSLFDTHQDIIDTLIKINILDHGKEYFEIEIVKQKGNKKDGYYYEPIPEEILLKDASKFFSVSAITSFLSLNKNNYSLIKEIVSYYLNRLKRLTQSFERKVFNLKSHIKYVSEEEKKSIQEEIKKKENSLLNFNYEITNLSRLLIVCEKLGKLSFFNRELEIEYSMRLDQFVRNETGYYYRDKKLSTNYRGLVQLANLVQGMTKKYPHVLVPESSTSYRDEKLNILKAVKHACSINEITNKSTNELTNDIEEEPGQDPDSFMFLEDEDFRRLISESTQQSIIEGIEDNIIQLEERQQKYGKK